MFECGYLQRLEKDLVRWVADGVITLDTAQSIRKASFAEAAGSRLPGIFAMLGALMLAASVSAFVAANWQEIPRTIRLAGILALIAGCFVPGLLMQRRGMPVGADAAITLATLCYGAGISLVGQMYHLPGDWPAGAMLIAIGGLVAAVLTGKNGPLVIAFVAMTSWSCGRFDAWLWRETHWAFLLLFVPAFLLALGRDNRLVAHTAVLALGIWLATVLAPQVNDRHFLNLVDGGLAAAVAYIALGLLALERDWPAVMKALLPWGVWVFGLLLCIEIGMGLERARYVVHAIASHVYPAYAVGVIALLALAASARKADHGKFVIITACAVGLIVPLLFSDMVDEGTRRVLVSVGVLATAVALIAGGLLGGLGTFIVAGYAVFGVSILILLWQTVGTLLNQSLFFLIAGVALLALAVGARFLANWSKRGLEPSGSAA